MDLLIVLGDQDTYHEDDEAVLASPRWLADLLTEEGLPGLFVFQARRAEILAEQGRRDVIAAVRRHEIGLHGRDIHPIAPELVEGLGWDEGVAVLLAVERAALATLADVFGTAPVCASEHRGFGAPQLFAVAAQLGLPYLFGFPAAPPRHSVSWFAGALNVPFDAPVPDFLGFFPAVFDDVLPDDTAFAGLLARLRAHVARGLAAGLPLLVVFVCHPARLCYTGPVERWQYGNGRNHGRAAVPAGVVVRRSRAEIARALDNARALLRCLRDTPGLEPTTVAALRARYGRPAATIARAELTALAGRALAERQIPIGPTASAAESILGFAGALVAQAAGGPLPSAEPRRAALGPRTPPPLAPEAPHLTPAQVMGLAGDLLAAVAADGHLPAALPIAGRMVGLGTLYGALAQAYLAAADGAPPAAVPLDVWPRYPAEAPALAERLRRCAEDPLARPGLSLEAAARHLQLQTWTLKPATWD
ncbi:MAG: hypothetical protein IT340_20735 [Chloroflexi bacterium]|nr:hypothetical protein [Chloroflexota bacterium]